MKKLAIMFVMLLGSVATMQAQTNTTFDFSCAEEVSEQQIEINDYNSQASEDNQVADWNESTANFDIIDSISGENVNYTIEYFDPNWEAIDDPDGLYNTIIAGSLANVIIAIIDRHSN